MIFSSFTKDEQKLILAVLVIAGLGYGGLTIRKSMVPALHYVEAPSPATGAINASALTGSTKSPLGTKRSHLLPNGKLDLNTATEPELEALPKVGPSLAGAIIDYRSKSGGFHAYAELDNVHGVGPSMMQKLAPLADIGQTTTTPAEAAVRGMQTTAFLAARAQSPAVSPVQSILNINTATAHDLESLNRIGPALAQRIVDYRSMHGGFRTVDELTAVKGIGPKTMELNRHRLTVR
jgi:competence protein ComEA